MLLLPTPQSAKKTRAIKAGMYPPDNCSLEYLLSLMSSLLLSAAIVAALCRMSCLSACLPFKYVYFPTSNYDTSLLNHKVCLSAHLSVSWYTHSQQVQESKKTAHNTL